MLRSTVPFVWIRMQVPHSRPILDYRPDSIREEKVVQCVVCTALDQKILPKRQAYDPNTVCRRSLLRIPSVSEKAPESTWRIRTDTPVFYPCWGRLGPCFAQGSTSKHTTLEHFRSIPSSFCLLHLLPPEAQCMLIPSSASYIIL